MLSHLLMKYLCEQNVINIRNSDIITGIWSHYSHRINTYPYLETIYHDIFLLNIKDIECNCKQSSQSMYILKHSFPKTE